jgi:hypothetical protein
MLLYILFYPVVVQATVFCCSIVQAAIFPERHSLTVHVVIFKVINI